MKNARPAEAETSAREQGDSKATASFCGTDNPRHLRVIQALRCRPMPREQLDREAGASNGPDLVADLRARGLDLPCSRTPCLDRDGREVRRGVYHFTQRDRIGIARWLARRARGDAL